MDSYPGLVHGVSLGWEEPIPLVVAIEENTTEIMKLLIVKGARLNTKNHSQKNILVLKILENPSRKAQKILELLLEEGLQPTQKDVLEILEKISYQDEKSEKFLEKQENLLRVLRTVLSKTPFLKVVNFSGFCSENSFQKVQRIFIETDVLFKTSFFREYISIKLPPFACVAEAQDFFSKNPGLKQLKLHVLDRFINEEPSRFFLENPRYKKIFIFLTFLTLGLLVLGLFLWRHIQLLREGIVQRKYSKDGVLNCVFQKENFKKNSPPPKTKPNFLLKLSFNRIRKDRIFLS